MDVLLLVKTKQFLKTKIKIFDTDTAVLHISKLSAYLVQYPLITIIFPTTIFFQSEEERFFFKKMCTKLLQKFVLANKIKKFHLHIYCILNVTLKFNFKLSFDFISVTPGVIY